MIYLLLSIELIPESSWEKNLRNKLTQYKWQKLSQEIQRKAQFSCEICKRIKGEEITRLQCHEVWEYDYSSNVQKLIGLQSLCFECHMSKHPGFSRSQTWIDHNSIETHFLKINNISKSQYDEYYANQRESWKKASNIDWEVDFGEWSYLFEAKEIKSVKEDEKEKQLELILNFLKSNLKATNKDILDLFFATSNLNKTSFTKLITRARKKVKQEHLINIFNGKY